MSLTLNATLQYRESIVDKCKNTDMFKESLKQAIGDFAEGLFIEVLENAEAAQLRDPANKFDEISVSVHMGNRTDKED